MKQGQVNASRPVSHGALVRAKPADGTADEAASNRGGAIFDGALEMYHGEDAWSEEYSEARRSDKATLSLRARDPNGDLSIALSWLRRIKATGSDTTFVSYRKEVDRFLLWLKSQNLGFVDVTSDTLSAYLMFLKDPQPASFWVGSPRARSHPQWKPFSGPLSQSSLRQARVILGNLFKFIADSGYLQRNPFNLLGRTRMLARRVHERTVDSDMWSAVWRYVCEKNEGIFADGEREVRHGALPSREMFESARERWILAVLYLGALRRSELANANMSDFYRQSGEWWLRVLGKGEKVRDVTVSNELIDELVRYRKHLGLSPMPSPAEGTPLVAKRNVRTSSYDRVSSKTIHLVIKKVFWDAADSVVSGDEELAHRLRMASAHWIRHGSASRKIEIGMPIEELREELGHSSIQTTQIYVHTSRISRHARTKHARLL